MSSAPVKAQKRRRNVLVIAGLLGSLSLTSALLLILAPSPLLPEPRSLMVLDSTPALEELFETQTPIQPNRWQYIFVHQSKTKGAEAAPAGDHFLITSTGQQIEIRIDPRWTYQKPASPAAASVAPTCITICLVGDFDQTAPTAMQVRRVQQLTAALQRRLSIPARNVIAYDPDVIGTGRANSASGLGRLFPSARLRDGLLP